MNILMVYARRIESHYLAFPVRVFRRAIQARGLNVTFSHDPFPRDLSKYDVIMVVQQYLDQLLSKTSNRREAVLQLLDRYHDDKLPVIWLDASDTTGRIDPQIMARVSVYAMRQLLQDRTQYLMPIYHGIAFQDYYQRTFQISTPNPEEYLALVPDTLQKLAVYWNLGLIDWRLQARRRLRRTVGIFFPRASYDVRLIPPHLDMRSVDVSSRLSFHAAQPIIAFHRQNVQRAVGSLGNRRVVHHEGKLPLHAYLDEMAAAKIVVSPFGLGEICYRDFEGFAAGAVVLKPDMSHLESFPAYYTADETYVAHRWDFGDLVEKMESILDQPRAYEDIAAAGQRHFAAALTDGEAFAGQFQKLVEQAVRAR
ncbi:MAG: glycosyltransferase [Chloroflexota bacterium]|nr:glycosyltransferase [Chloroflexota bacterium]